MRAFDRGTAARPQPCDVALRLLKASLQHASPAAMQRLAEAVGFPEDQLR